MPTCRTDPVFSLIVVDTASPITIGAQITEQIKLLIARGNLKPNQPLPPIIHLAKYLGVNHTIVATEVKERSLRILP